MKVKKCPGGWLNVVSGWKYGELVGWLKSTIILACNYDLILLVRAKPTL